MTNYEVPSGWVETFSVYSGERRNYIFHVSRSCPRIRTDELRAVERPGSAVRCKLCASEDAVAAATPRSA